MPDGELDTRTQAFVLVAGAAAALGAFLLFGRHTQPAVVDGGPTPCAPGFTLDPATARCIPISPGGRGRASPCPPLGDVDGDGVVTAKDGDLISQAVAGLITLTPSQATRADVNGDGVVDEIDHLLILQYAAGQIATFSGCARRR